MKKRSSTRGMNRVRRELNHYLDRAIGGMALIAVHEAGALQGHWTEINERVAIARRARTASELIRDQLDLLPESRNRMRRDQDIRRELWRGLVKDLAAPVLKAV